MRHVVYSSILALLILSPSGDAQESKIELVSMKYDDLKSLVAKHRGKVVYVDFWEFG